MWIVGLIFSVVFLLCGTYISCLLFFLSTLLAALFRVILKRLTFSGTVYRLYNPIRKKKRFAIPKNFWEIFSIVFSVLFPVVIALIYLGSGVPPYELFDMFKSNTVMGSLLELTRNFFESFSLEHLLSVGISAYIMGLLYKPLKDKKWYVTVPCSITLQISAAFLSILLSRPFSAISIWAPQFLETLSNASRSVIITLLLIVLYAYLSLLLLAATLEEYSTLLGSGLFAYAICRFGQFLISVFSQDGFRFGYFPTNSNTFFIFLFVVAEIFQVYGRDIQKWLCMHLPFLAAFAFDWEELEDA